MVTLTVVLIQKQLFFVIRLIFGGLKRNLTSLLQQYNTSVKKISK